MLDRIRDGYLQFRQDFRRRLKEEPSECFRRLTRFSWRFSLPIFIAISHLSEDTLVNIIAR